MERARVAIIAAVLVILSVSGAAIAASMPAAPVPAAAVTWPPSSTLLLAELQTGGASASDEFVEITNAGPATVDLDGLEVVYVTSTGGTITRKASWSAARPLDPGRHLLIANTSGIFAGVADATYSGGFAATGGSIVLRPIGGAPIDAIGWGDATNAFVEDSAAPAPAAGASIERRPGGLAGNTADTNANAADWFVQATPNPQNLAAPPVPAPLPSATPQPTATPEPTPTATSVATAEPSLLPSAPPSVEPSVEPSLEPTAPPSVEPSSTPEPTPIPTATVEPTPSPAITPAPTATPEITTAPTSIPTATPAPTSTPIPIVSIAAARTQANGTTATIVGVLTTRLGALEAGRKGVVQDATGGIAIYLDAAITDGLPAGTLVQVTGTLDDRFAERTLRAAIAGVIAAGSADLPEALLVATGSVDESVEGARVVVEGLTVGSSSALADGLGIFVDDGSGTVRAVIGADALGLALIPAGTHVRVTGPVGQHDSSGTGTTAYRVQATLTGELEILPTPTPSAPPTPAPTGSPTAAPTATPAPSPIPTATPASSATPSPVPTPSPSPTPTPSPSPTPTPSASPSPSVITILDARGLPIGTTVTVAGVVTAESGRLGTPSLIAIADATGGIVVRVPDGLASPGRGTTVRVTGPLADPYAQLEVRPSSGGFRVTGTGVVPTPAAIDVADLGEATEARLVLIVGTVRTAPTKATSGDITIDLVDAAGRTFRAAADASSGIKASDIALNKPLQLTGIVGQRASRKGALDGYRVWLRDAADVALVPGGAGPSPSPGGGPAVVSVAAALAATDGATVTIEATVTAGVTLLDTTGRRIVVEDASGAIEVLLPSGAAAPSVGARLRVSGERTHAWGAPRIRAISVASLGGGPAVVAGPRSRSLAERDEWRLVRLSGTVLSVERVGDRWRAEIRLANGDRVPILGQAGAGIPSTAIVEGRAATIVGIVKRPYPTATDQRFGLLPRSSTDLALGPAGGGTAESAGTAGGSGTASGAADVTPDTDLATLAEHVGAQVRVGGLVHELEADGFLLDDGTAIGRVTLAGDALALLPYLRVGDALAARGLVVRDGQELRVAVASAGDLVRVGDLGQAVPVLAGAGAAAGGTSSDPSGLGEPTATLAGAGDVLPTELSLATLGGLSAASVLVTILRRKGAARRSRVLVLARLASLGRPNRP